MKAYIRLMRPSVCLITVLGIIAGSIISGSIERMFFVLLAMVSAFLITGAGNVFNDFFDIEIDRINAPHRPLPSGMISKASALIYGAIINAIGLVIAYFINELFLAIAILNSAVLVLYAWKLKRTPLIGNAATSYLGASSFIAAGFIKGISGINTAIIFVALISFLGTMSREIFKDIEDIRGDRKTGAKTLPVLWGEKRSSVLGYFFMYMSCTMLLYPIITGMFSFYYAVFALSAVVLCIYAFWQPPAKVQRILKIVMYIVLLGFVAGSVAR